MSYSANDELKELVEFLNFDIYLFDDPVIYCEQIKLREKKKEKEVDALILHDNILLVVGINEGINENNILKEIRDYFQRLDLLNCENINNLEIVVTAKDKESIKNKILQAETDLNQIKQNIETQSADYYINLRKIFFVPNIILDDEFIREKRDCNEFIIDKDLFSYFIEVTNTLGKDNLRNEFFHYLNIQKYELEKRSLTKLKKPGKTSPYKVTRMELEKSKMIMYTTTMRVEELIEYVTVWRIAQKYDKNSFQRMLSKRIYSIDETYLNKNETFPNNVIILLDPMLYNSENDFYNKDQETLELFKEFNSLIIIDGQHRFFSFVVGNKTSRNILASFLFLKGGSDIEKFQCIANTFYQINKNQKRIDPNLAFILDALLNPNSEEYFWYNVFKKLDKKGFFRERFSFKESVIRDRRRRSAISLLKYGGVINLNNPRSKKGINFPGLNIFYNDDVNNNIDTAFKIIKNYFDIIEDVLHDQDFRKSYLTTRDIGALFRLLRHFLYNDANKVRGLNVKDIMKLKSENALIVRKYFKEILECIQFDELKYLVYSTSNWGAIEGYFLKRIQEKGFSFGEPKLLTILVSMFSIKVIINTIK